MVIPHETCLIAAGIGTALGLIIGVAYSIHRVRQRKGKGNVLETLTYSDLIKFADKCKSRVPGIVKSRVACERFEDTEGEHFRVLQLMLDIKLHAVKTPQDEVVGRIVTCKKIDDKIRVLCGDEFPSDFDLEVSHD